MDEGVLFRVISTSPYMVGEGKEGQEAYKDEDMILPGRFLPLLQDDRLPIIGRYSGMQQTKCGTKTYYEVRS